MPALAAGPRPLTPDGSSSSSSSYILLVQHLIEKCIVFNMDRRECVEALSKHANIEPVITMTVWNELEKENKDFFSSYFKNMKNRKEEDYCSQAAPERRLGQDCRSDSDNRPHAKDFMIN